MQIEPKPSLFQRVRTLVIGGARSPYDSTVFHKLSLIAFFAWVGLGADGLSSSCYGPEEAFLALQGHTYLGIFVALGSALTIFVISASYSQIIELFPTGGGGYLVASKLLSPSSGMLSGCALLIDYVLTITISIASGTDALFSFLPPQWHHLKLEFALAGVVVLLLLNMRGVKESVLPLVPIFLIFVFTHAFVIVYTFIMHMMDFPTVVSATVTDVQKASAELGVAGVIFLILKAYSMGAGTFTGIEAVSNGIPILRDPKVQTAKRTMQYMAISLAFTVVGLMFAYLLYKVQPEVGKTLNAVLFERLTATWGEGSGYFFVLITLFSEAALLLVAAQAGFLDGPRVLANMALDRWFPMRFAMLSDRFVTQNGILMMGGAAFLMMLLTHGSVRFLVVLYSINVFITFVLSQLGMVSHWWNSRTTVDHWKRRLLINGIGLIMTVFILVSVVVLKFHEGGWITILITGTLVALVMLIRRHYEHTGKLLKRLDNLVAVANNPHSENLPKALLHKNQSQELNPKAKTAILLVNGFTGLGLHTLFSVFRLFGDVFKNFIFVQIGVIDAGNFKGTAELERLQKQVKNDVDKYVDFMERHGYYAEGIFSIGIDVVDEVAQIAPQVLQRFPQSIFFGGQIVLPRETLLSRWLHNYTVFAIQRRFYQLGIPVVILPI
ncbi:MAG: APC family permease [Candidatus Tectomicrobia bacterium]|uniref:APC family permease n=1 Tax=Tectimicrobiota bacterium TaxID=2528274 RepID=A0A933GP80_UNCTE|nr:APC family permease [Candidatus Tectomicrobia bacterium]